MINTSSEHPRTAKLTNGLELAIGSLEENLERIQTNLKSTQGMWVVTLNLQMIYLCIRDDNYRRLLGDANVITADGMPLVWLTQVLKHRYRLRERTTGVDLLQRLLESQEAKHRIGLIGGQCPQVLLKRFPYSVFYAFGGTVDVSSDCIEAIADQCKRHGVNLVFLALGAPKQDYFAQGLRLLLPDAVIIGVGGAFEFLAEQKPRAPLWMQRTGLEWLHRFMAEPGKLWRRYLFQYPVALAWLLREAPRFRAANSETGG